MKSIMSSEEMNATNHYTLRNGWKVLTETAHVWKFNAARNRWENWR